LRKEEVRATGRLAAGINDKLWKRSEPATCERKGDALECISYPF
jgi:hypothetical protein